MFDRWCDYSQYLRTHTYRFSPEMQNTLDEMVAAGIWVAPLQGHHGSAGKSEQVWTISGYSRGLYYLRPLKMAELDDCFLKLILLSMLASIGSSDLISLVK